MQRRNVFIVVTGKVKMVSKTKHQYIQIRIPK